MLYRIHLTNPPVDETRRRSDAALDAAYRIAWDALVAAGEIRKSGPRDSAAARSDFADTVLQSVNSLDPKRGGAVKIGSRVLFVTPSHGG